ncbi:MAG: hypothetical protein LBV02_00985 [Bacteroidales bacterium]|jgi:hypothetical protein|nr:hypothetical protein [Bacteroidales bacterium]
MSIFSVKRPEKREFKYKPRFYEKDGGGIKDANGEIDTVKMAERLHRSWSSKRKARKHNTQFGLVFFISMALILILVYLVLQFVLD